jgi:hypothetical protein
MATHDPQTAQRGDANITVNFNSQPVGSPDNSVKSCRTIAFDDRVT